MQVINLFTYYTRDSQSFKYSNIVLLTVDTVMLNIYGYCFKKKRLNFGKQWNANNLINFCNNNHIPYTILILFLLLIEKLHLNSSL